MNLTDSYEQGPIRPPSEAKSLLLRITRNCPWNRCAFCPVYKQNKFSKRSLRDIKADLDTIASQIQKINYISEDKGYGGTVDGRLITEMYDQHQSLFPVAFWLYQGGNTIFLQDADTMVLPANFIKEVLDLIKSYFPKLKRITTYARSASILKHSVEDLVSLKKSGLNRIHIGLESGSNRVLELMKKGVSGEEHIEAGKRVKQAGIILSEYIMPGLGGKALWQEHAIETARVLNAINPDFIRFRTLTIHPESPLHELKQKNIFTPLSDDQVIEEELLLISNLNSIQSEITSDHSLNLLEEIAGKLPEDKDTMLKILKMYLGLPKNDRDMYRLGKRLGYYRSLNDALANWPDKRVQEIYNKIGQNKITVDDFIQSMMMQLI